MPALVLGPDTDMVEATEAARSAAEVSGSASLWDMTVRSFDMPGQAVMLIAVRERVRAPEAAAWEDAPRLDRSSDVPGSPALEEFGGAGGGSRIKQQKTSGPAVAKSSSAYDQGTKVFWFLFSKKNRLPCLALPRNVPRRQTGSKMRRAKSAGRHLRAAPPPETAPQEVFRNYLSEPLVRPVSPGTLHAKACLKRFLTRSSVPRHCEAR